MRSRFLVILALSFFFSLGMKGVLAVPPGPPDDNPQGDTGALKGQVETGGSYDAHSGNATRSVTDISVPGALGDYGLDLTRHWNSLPNDYRNEFATCPSDFGAASGWSHSWGWSAVYGEEYPEELPGTHVTDNLWTTSITITFPDGHANKYKIVRYGPGEHNVHPNARFGPPYIGEGEINWPDPGRGVHDHLKMAPDGTEFWLYRADGGTVHFTGGPEGYLATEIFDPHGFRTELDYGDDYVLDTVTQDGGRFLKFTWGYIGGDLVPFIKRVETGGGAGVQAVEYAYTSVGGFVTLARVKYPEGADAIYTYGNAYGGALGGTSWFPLLKKASDPRYNGAMKQISYTYRGDRCWPSEANEPYPYTDHFFYFYAQPEAIEEERSSKTGTLVSGLSIGCFSGTRTDYNGLGGARTFYYGAAPGGTEGNAGYQLGKVTDFGPGSVSFRSQSHAGGGHPWQVWDGRGIETRIAHADDSGLPTAIIHPADGSSYTYDRTTQGLSSGRDTTRIPNPNRHWLFRKTDENHNTTTYTRDHRRRTTRIDHPGGSFEEFSYDNTLPHSFNLVTRHRLASGAIVHYEYDARGLLQREWNELDGYEERKEYTYDEFDRILTMQDGLARAKNKDFSTKTTYNRRHQELTIEYAGMNNSPNPTVTHEYDELGNRTATIDELGHRKDFTYDAYGRRTSSTEQIASGEGCNNVQVRRWDWIYDREIEYGPNSRGTFTASAHTSKEWRIQIEPEFNDARDRRATARTFDVNNRMLSERTGLIQAFNAPLGTLQTVADTETHRVTYNENGQKKTSTDPLDRITTYDYDSRNRLETTTEPKRQDQSNNPVTRIEYDEAGNKKKVTFPDLEVQRWENYDAFGQPARFIDERDNPTDLTYKWGPMKKLDTVRTYREKDGGGLETQETTFDYDWMGRPTQTLFPDGSTEVSTYEFGLLKTYKTRKGQTKVIDVYDARGREEHHFWLKPNGSLDKTTPAITRVWDDASRLTSISNVFSTISYVYDSAGQVRVEGTSVAGSDVTKEMAYCRYPNGEVSQITYPDGSTVVNRYYTARGQLSSVGWGSGATSYVYLPDGKVDYQAFTNPNGVVTRYGYDGRGMIQSVSHQNAGGQNLAYREYWRDDRDRILAWKRGPVGGPNGMEDGRGDRYHYDEEGQLDVADYRALSPETTTPSQPKRRDKFHYDELGNRMGSNNVVASRGASAVSFTRRDNRLNQYVDWTPSVVYYDDNHPNPPPPADPVWIPPANGVMMADGWITASFNALNQPMGIWSPVYPGGESAQFMWFGYDPLGRCVKRWMGNDQRIPVGPNPTTYFYYDGWNLVQEGPGGSTVDRTYVHGGRVDEIVASQASGVWAYHHYDARGHCILLTKASDGSILEQYDYDAFGFPYSYKADGNKLIPSEQFGNRFLFTGREWLKDLRVYDYRNRMYQPELGRFLQPDPKGFEAGDYNLYRYCHNDPVNRSDPTGLVENITEDFRWRSACLRDSGNSFQGSLAEFMNGSQDGTNGAAGSHEDRSIASRDERAKQQGRLKIATGWLKERHKELDLPDPTKAPAKLEKLEPGAASSYHPMRGIKIDPEKKDNMSVAGMVQQYSHELLHYKDGAILWFLRSFFPNEKRHDEIKARASEIRDKFIQESSSPYIEDQ